jgi:hypothetical protein
MDPLSVTTSIIGLVQNFNYAFLAIGGTFPEEHRRMIREYSINIRVLEFCSGVIQTAHEGPLLETILEVARQCTVIGQELAYKTTGKGVRKRIAYVLAPWQRLLALYNDFTTSVSLLHELVQR